MKQVLFGEMIIKEREGAYDKHTEERKEILAYRKTAEIEEHKYKTVRSKKSSTG
ncbi:MAG: hypothetical protein OQK46_01365 [Gammaproteobacteria bacterium]|nr:hypothetical protein [Gammaproteobacteria bacterium]